MLSEASLRNPVLINTVGHTAGMLLFGFIIALLIRDRRTHGVRETRLSIVAASLAFVWNIGSLIALGADTPESLSIRIIMTASFGVLSLLPAILLQVALQGRFPAITNCGYFLSGVAILLHVAELVTTALVPHQIALLVIAAGFPVLTVLAFSKASTRDVQTSGRTEWLSLACLLMFALSFPHFGYPHFRSPWAAEIAWHHIGIPVALIVLLQDYRFLLLDTFIRFLMNSALAAAYVICFFLLDRRFQLESRISSSVFASGLALVAVCLSLILFAHTRNRLQQWIGRAIFRRQNLESRIRVIAQLSAKTASEEALISGAARQVAAYFGAARFAVVTQWDHTEAADRPAMLHGERSSYNSAEDVSWAEARIPLRFSSGELRFLLTGPRRGRQRYLSEDLEDMHRLASVIVEQVERFRSEELRRLAAQAELRALQSQINPHFLFNAFNTLYGAIDRESSEARRLVLNLTDIFRYLLHGDRSEIPFSEELRIVKAYLEIEALRLGERLETELDIDDSALPVSIPVLSIQPLVENAVKHGVAAKLGPGRVVVRAHCRSGILLVSIEDQSLGVAGIPTPVEGTGVGLTNVRRRLNLAYGPESTLDLSQTAQGTLVQLVIPALGRSSYLRNELGVAS